MAQFLNFLATGVEINLDQLSPPTVLIALISFIVKFYLLFRVNFIYSKLVFY